MSLNYRAVVLFKENTITLTIGYIDNKKIYILDSMEAPMSVFNKNNGLESVDAVYKTLTKMYQTAMDDLHLTSVLPPVSTAFIIPPFNASYSQRLKKDYPSTNDNQQVTYALLESDTNSLLSSLKYSNNKMGVCTPHPFTYILNNSTRYNHFPLHVNAQIITTYFHVWFTNYELVSDLLSLRKKLDWKNTNIYLSSFASQRFLLMNQPQGLGMDYFILDVGRKSSTLGAVNSYVLRQCGFLPLGINTVIENLSKKLKVAPELIAEYLKKFGNIPNPIFDIPLADGKLNYSDFQKALKEELNGFIEQIDLFIKNQLTLHYNTPVKSIVIQGEVNKINGLLDYLNEKKAYPFYSIYPMIFGHRNGSDLATLGGFYCLEDLVWQRPIVLTESVPKPTMPVERSSLEGSLRKSKED